MRERQDDGFPLRTHLEKAAERGHAAAIAALEGPPVPEALRYLYDWIFELDATRGHDMSGNRLPVTYAEMGAWARLRGRRPKPHETEALLLLDAVLRNPPKLPAEG